MALLLDQRGDEVPVTEEVVKAAAGNEENGMEVMALLLDRRGDKVSITEEVVRAAAQNRGKGKEVMALLLDRRGDEVSIIVEVVKAAARNGKNGKEVMELLLNRRGDEVSITEEVVKAAAGNRGNGKEVMALLLHRSLLTRSFISSAVLRIAAACGQLDILRFLSRQACIVTVQEEDFAIARLYNAAASGTTTTVKELLQTGTPPDTQNIWGMTPLWIAAAHGHEQVVRLLLTTNKVSTISETTIRNAPYTRPSYDQGDTALMVARKNRYNRIAESLEQ
ncbi:Uu.00g129500.m01.CDS01 [Anthostomella pinea]|uniref:Uu.00g129500.m01.CDS01 n=1 Tax=Anthostomella pinea TaxID=933095 RepID=A0AAI8VJ43_9PEZI|nr:Uu.00g129500.m01.CDS01 [Anthostomella pinea]